MGTAMSLQEFKGVVKITKGVLVGILCQFTIKHFVGYALAIRDQRKVKHPFGENKNPSEY